jgi:mRNA interferase HicA
MVTFRLSPGCGLLGVDAITTVAHINNIVYNIICEEQRVQALAGRSGSNIQAGQGSHLKVTLNGKNSVLPMHSKELGAGLVAAIKKQLGLK